MTIRLVPVTKIGNMMGNRDVNWQSGEHVLMKLAI